MKTEEISIRSIQHYMYCQHRWGLMEIDRAWSENFYVTKANLMHERVHDWQSSYSAKGKKVYTSVPVYNDLNEYNLYGVTDCLEFKGRADCSNENEVQDICIVEYKPTQPKNKAHHEDDVMQIFAQKICVDYTFKCDSKAVIYYADTKKRYELPFAENYSKYDSELKALLKEMRLNIVNGHIPPINKGQKCNGCSMKDICMPGMRKNKNLSFLIDQIDKEDF
ncbi:MAG: CRISPR-associated protein Cas4 [Firmicutes bacterium]|jgi:CRISPR-associated exonuclease Cas4|nr:CRISPR-associated protein Cas4 [Bacillota bacterium]